MVAHDARSVANELIKLSLANKRPLTPMQIIKLVYLCHGWMLGLYGRPLVQQTAEAWRYGPVFYDLYQALKGFGSNVVTDLIPDAPTEQFDEQERDLIRQVYNKYGRLSGIRLSNITHLDGSPWHKTWAHYGEQSAPISNDMIAEYFGRLASERLVAPAG